MNILMIKRVFNIHSNGNLINSTAPVQIVIAKTKLQHRGPKKFIKNQPDGRCKIHQFSTLNLATSIYYIF